VPAATPVPRGPSFLTLYSAADLLTAPGCPVCRYADEASDRYLGWFALEGHAQPDTITTLCGSLGMCARHTRRLMGQPGSAIRLTAVYRYVLTAARDRLANGGPRVRSCPGCEHDDAAARRALDTLLDGLADGATMSRCRDLGGVCIPHLGAAARCGQRPVVAWLAETMRASLAARQAPPGWLAGTDDDAEARAVLRQAIPAVGTQLPGACAACLEAAQAERDSLAWLVALGSEGADGAEQGLWLCGRHLADAAITATTAGRLRALLAWQAACLAATRRPARWVPGRRGHHPPCPACQAVAEAARRAVSCVLDAAGSQPPERCPTLCVRHHLALCAADQRAGRRAARGLIEAADLLIRELAEGFELTTWARRNGGPAAEPTAWRRAAAFLDGGVYGGCLPRGR
jgi:hypothetical protein